MKVRLYTGSLKLVEKSGVGRALHHQEAMLLSAHIKTVYKNERDVAVVHINTVFPDSLAAAVLAKLRGQKVIYYGHSTIEDFRNSFRLSNVLAPLFGKWIRLCYGMGDAVITPTEYAKERLLSYGIKKPIYVLSNGIDTDFFKPNAHSRRAFREKYGLSDRDQAVISVGHYIERKGILDFIALARRLPEVRFFWFGYTNLNLIPGKIREAIQNAPSNLTFPGYVGREELRDAYCGCDLFCFMSNEETEGIVVLEALSCGIPALVREIPVYADWLTDGREVYKGWNAESFYRLTRAILGGAVADLTQAGRQAAISRSIPKMAKRLQTVYREVLQSDCRAALLRVAEGRGD